MPEMTGIQFLQALRSRGDATPFCFVTSEGSDEMREQAAASGAAGPHRQAVHGRGIPRRPLPGGVRMSTISNRARCPAVPPSVV
jgi:CheY-like chemotaxis protein